MIISRQEAIKRGLKKYYTGEPCIHGHIAERYVAKSACVECKKIQQINQKKNAKAERIKKYGNVTRFFTGEPCSRGHVAERFVNNNRCVECHNEDNLKVRRAQGVKSREEISRAAAAKKEKKSKAYKDSLLNDYEKQIVKYARDCLARVKGRSETKIPLEVAEFECGYSYRELDQHLSKKNKKWNHQDNFGKYHIDHIIPLSKLVKYGVTEVEILNSLDNLRLLTKKQNLSKNNKLRISNKKFEEYVVKKWSSCKKILGNYDPKERRRELANAFAEDLFKEIKTKFLSRACFNARVSDQRLFDSIVDDLYNNHSKYLNSFDSWKKNYYFKSEGKVNKILTEAYVPLKKLKTSLKKKFTYIDECEEYFRDLEKSKSDEVLKSFLFYASFDCRDRYERREIKKEKRGFFKKLFS